MKIGTFGTKPVLLGTLGLIGVSTYLGTKHKSIFQNESPESASFHDISGREIRSEPILFEEGSADYVDVGSGDQGTGTKIFFRKFFFF